MARRGGGRPGRTACARMALGLVMLAVTLCLTGIRARATVFVPMSIEDLTRSSAAVVIATVERVGSGVDASGQLVTAVELRVAQTLKGTVAGPTLILQEPGGRMGPRREVVFGAPQYRSGERVVVFVSVAPDGSLRTSHLALGQYLIVPPADGGAAQAQQRLGPDTAVLVTRGSVPWRPALPLAELVERVQRASSAGASAATPLPSDPGGGAGGRPAFPYRETSVPFTLQGNARFFEADLGDPIVFTIDQRGDDILGLDVSRQAVDDAFRTWTDVADASLTLADGGLRADVSIPCEAGRHVIRFNDPDNQIQDPVDCQGVLGLGGSCFTDAEQKVFNGQQFDRSLRGAVTFADNWEGCDVWTACNFAEVATHEIGHAIGLGHSSEDPNEADPRLSGATMYFRGRFDGRCAGLQMDDIDGLTFIYPTALPPTITTPEQLPDGTTNTAYSTQLAAVGGMGALTWSLVGEECTGFPGLTLSAEGLISGAPTAFGEGCFLIRAADANGNSHTKQFLLTVELAGTNTRTPTPSRTPTVVGPTFTPTATRIPGGPCTGDCDDNGQVGIDELVRGVNIALGTALVDVCPAMDENNDGQVTVNELIQAVNNALGACS